MKCKGIIQEQNKQTECWLPASPLSSLHLCRRCHFHSITNVLDYLTNQYWQGELHPEYELMLNDTDFLNELLHPAREQALLNLLSALFLHNKIQFHRVLSKLKQYTVFPILLTKRIHNHAPGIRCSMYREFLKDSSLYKAQSHCSQCWSCITWGLKRGPPYLYDIFAKSFLYNLPRFTLDVYRTNGSRVFVDFMITLQLLGKDHIVRIFLDHCFHVFPLEDFKSLFMLFMKEPLMLPVFFEKKQDDFLPLPLRDEVVRNEFRNEIKQWIKQKTDLYKEELVMRTWHPSRLFPWCLDIVELEEFGVSSTDRALGRYGF